MPISVADSSRDGANELEIAGNPHGSHTSQSTRLACARGREDAKRAERSSFRWRIRRFHSDWAAVPVGERARGADSGVGAGVRIEGVGEEQPSEEGEDEVLGLGAGLPPQNDQNQTAQGMRKDKDGARRGGCSARRGGPQSQFGRVGAGERMSPESPGWVYSANPKSTSEAEWKNQSVGDRNSLASIRRSRRLYAMLGLSIALVARMLFKVTAHRRKTLTSRPLPLPSLPGMMCNAIYTSILLGTLFFSTRQPLNCLGSRLRRFGDLYRYRQRPLHMLARVERAIEACEEVLKLAKTNCARNYSELTDGTRRFLEAKLSVSKIQTQLLETRGVTTWEEFVEYLHDVRETMRNISQCAKKVKEVRRSTLLTIEAERQRQLSEGMKEVCEIHETVLLHARQLVVLNWQLLAIHPTTYQWCSSNFKFFSSLWKVQIRPQGVEIPSVSAGLPMNREGGVARALARKTSLAESPRRRVKIHTQITSPSAGGAGQSGVPMGTACAPHHDAVFGKDTMCNIISTSILFGVLSLLPGNRYIALGLVSVALIIYAANRQRPSCKLSRVERKIQACEETLKLAKTNCARSYLELMDGTRQLLEAELSASKIQTQLLETRSVTNWEEFVEYLSDLWEIMQNISQCAKKVKEVRRSTLLAIESERQRQLSEGIKEVCEIHETVICSPAAARPTTRPATRRLGLAATRNTSYEISMWDDLQCE
ncbi:hypothetical protein B0H14DRAFT_3598955 [Mycena olivaceomarginata]|nr:hypothetical protein B0H14DRAFT_3598955 [Mycena olivaceomarginata]